MAGADLLCTVPLSVYFIYVDLTSEPGLQPYLGWADTHADFYRVDQIPAILWRHNSHNARVLEVSRWIVVVCAFIFFMFFGFADEARKHYRTAYQTLVKTVGMSGSMTLGMTTSNAAKTNMRSFGNTSMPVFVRRQPTSKRGDSIGSYNEKLSIADAGGALADYKPDPYTLTEFSGTTSTTGSTMPADDDYSISMAEPPAIVRPEPTLDVSSIPRHPTDTPYSAHGSRHNSVDMV
jgi:pheromone a factor receptor